MLNCSSSKGDTYLLLENLNVLLFSLAYIGNMTLAIKMGTWYGLGFRMILVMIKRLKAKFCDRASKANPSQRSRLSTKRDFRRSDVCKEILPNFCSMPRRQIQQCDQ